MKSPQAFQIVNQARQNQSNPMDLFKQVTSNYSPKQIDELFSKATQMGVPNEYIEQVKSSINTK